MKRKKKKKTENSIPSSWVWNGKCNNHRPFQIYSVKFRNLVSSSSNSCKSPSVILFWRLGIRDLASSALSQHRLPISKSVTRHLPCRYHGSTLWGGAIKLTELRPLKHLQFCMRVQEPLNGFDVLLVLKPRKYIQVIQRLVQVPVERSCISILLFDIDACMDRNLDPHARMSLDLSPTYSGSSYLLPPRRLFSRTL